MSRRGTRGRAFHTRQRKSWGITAVRGQWGRVLRLESRDPEDPRLARDPSCCGTGRKETALGETWQDLITDQKERRKTNDRQILGFWDE